MDVKPRIVPYLLLLVAVTCLSAALFLLGYQYDNKYTFSRHPATRGVTVLDMERYEQRPFLYLLDGWAFYRDVWLTPKVVDGMTPDAYFYIGRYSGLDLGESSRSPYGVGTYRMQVLADENLRSYALETPKVYSQWQLWVNGTLLRSEYTGERPLYFDPASPQPDNRMVTFTAAGRIDILLAVSSENSLYSGMVYPPAFGSPESVGKTLTLRLLIHAGGCAVALLIGLLCLLVGIGTGFRRNYGALFLLCLCLAVFTTYPILQALGMYGDIWSLLQRFCHYGMFLLIIWLQGSLCEVSPKLTYGVCTAGALICLSVLLQPLVPAPRAGVLYAYGALLAYYKWLAAVYLLGVGVWAVWKNKPCSRALLAGFCVFGSALVIDRLRPLYEPILLGWPVELAGAALMFVIAGLLWQNTVRVYRDSAVLREWKKLTEFQLKARAEYARLQQEYILHTERLLHETRNHFVVLQSYNARDEREKLAAYLAKLLEDGDISPVSHTENELVNAILHIQLNRARLLNVYVELDPENVPPRLPLADADLSALLMNVLDNALEACAKLQEEERWLCLRLGGDGGVFFLECTNSAEAGVAMAEGSTKRSRGHGHGLSLLRETAARYGGTVQLERTDEEFYVRIFIPAKGAVRES